jgi:hypothetical protein
VSESPSQTRKHIEALTKFESDYREYIKALEADWSAMLAAEAGVDEEGAGWSQEEWGQRKRQLQMDAVRADRAIKASGVGGVVFTEAPAAGGRVRSADLPSQIFDFIEVNSFGLDDGLTFQRKLLERMPSQIAGLEIRLEEAETAEEEADMRLFGEVFEESRERHRQAQERREGRATKSTQQRQPTDKEPERTQPWWENPWIVGIGVTVIGGLAVLGIVALLGGG